MQRIFDLSHQLSERTPVYPGNCGIKIEVIDVATPATIQESRRLNSSRINVGLHDGTHLDAPFHFFNDGIAVDRIPIANCCGQARVIDVRNTAVFGIIDVNDLENNLRSDHCPILLLRSDWDVHWETPNYFAEHPVLTREAAMWIVAHKFTLVGVDFPSVDRDPFEAHQVLLGNNVLIVENLCRLSELPNTHIQFFAIPLAISGRDASPIRAIAIG